MSGTRPERGWRHESSSGRGKWILWVAAATVCGLVVLFFFGHELEYLVIRNSNWTRSCIPHNHLEKEEYRIAIVMSYELGNYAELGRLAEENKREYADKHGYDVIVNNRVADGSRKPSWTKVVTVADTLEGGYDWVMWIDTDSIIMDMEFRIEELIDDRYDFLITEDHRGINAGMWLVKNSAWTREFMVNWYDHGEKVVQKLRPTATRSGDQDTLKKLIPVHEEHFKIMPQCSFNSYPFLSKWEGVYMKGDFNLHLAGKGDAADRVELFHKFQKGEIYSVTSPR